MVPAAWAWFRRDQVRWYEVRAVARWLWSRQIFELVNRQSIHLGRRGPHLARGRKASRGTHIGRPFGVFGRRHRLGLVGGRNRGWRYGRWKRDRRVPTGRRINSVDDRQVVFTRQSTSFQLHILLSDRVLGSRLVVAKLGFDDSALSVQDAVDVDGQAVLFLGFQRQQYFTRSDVSVEAALTRLKGANRVGQRVAQIVDDFPFLLAVDGSFVAQRQFGVRDGGVALAESIGIENSTPAIHS